MVLARPPGPTARFRLAGVGSPAGSRASQARLRQAGRAGFRPVWPGGLAVRAGRAERAGLARLGLEGWDSPAGLAWCPGIVAARAVLS